MNEFTLHELPEGFIVTSDEIKKDGDLLFNTKAKNPELFIKNFKYDSNDVCYKKVIAQQDQIDFTALSEEEQKRIGWFDIKQLALQEFKNYDDGFVSYIDMTRGYELGFQKSQELLSDRRFTLEDIEQAMIEGLSIEKFWERCVQFLSQKSWKVELEMICGNSILDNHICTHKVPKLTNGKIKILKLL